MTERCDRCCDARELQRYLREQLAERDEARVRSHLDDCPTCQNALERAAADPEAWAEVRDGLGALDAADGGLDGDRDLARLQNHLAPTDDPAMLGRLGRYEVVGLVGQGSTGAVVKALDPQLHRYVAIKILSPIYAGNAIARKRFEREARSIAAVNHEHVIPVHAVDEHAGLPFIVMPYASAGSLLQRILRRGPLDSCEITRVGMQVARGLAAAHQQGIVHRDVKPANVMLEDGVERAMVTDFGLARVADDAAMTRSGVIAGTPQFMSPEQAKGLPVDPRSDLFSLGSTLYMAATGREPFRSDTVFGVIKKVCDDEPAPIRSLAPEIAPWLAAFVERLMQKDRELRFGSASEVADALERELAHLQNPTIVPEPARPWMARERRATRTRRRPGQPRTDLQRDAQPWWARPGVTAAALLVAGLGIAVGYGLWRPDGSTPQRIDLGGADLATETRFDGAAQAGFATALDAAQPGRATVEYSRRFELPANQRLVFTGTFESIEIRTHPVAHIGMDVSLDVDADTAARAEAIARHHSIQRVRGEGPAKGGDLELEGRLDPELLRTHRLNPIHAVAIVLTVPEGIDLDLVSGTGAITVDERGGDLDVASNSGDVRLAAIRGDVVASTVSARLDVTLGRGDVEARSETGAVFVRATPGSRGSSEIETESGAIQVMLLDGCRPAVLARSDEGSIRAQGGSTDGSTWSLQAGHGSAAELRIRSRSGGIAIVRASSEDRPAGFPRLDDAIRGFGGFPDIPDGLRPDSIPDVADVADVADVPDAVEIVEEPVLQEMEVFEEVVEEPEVVVEEPILEEIEVVEEALVEQPEIVVEEPVLEEIELVEEVLVEEPEIVVEEAIVETPILEPADVADPARAAHAGPPRPGAIATIEHPFTGGVLDACNVYLPYSWTAEGGPYPVILFLGGGCVVGCDLDEIAEYGLPSWELTEFDPGWQRATNERDRLAHDTFVIVTPHLTEGEYEARQFYQQEAAIGELLDLAIARFRGDADRVYLAGMGRGGHGAWGLASRMPERFAAVVPVRGHTEGVTSVEALADLPLWVGHGKDDGDVPAIEAMRVARQLEGMDGEAFLRMESEHPATEEYLAHDRLFTLLPTADWPNPFSTEHVYRWLLQHRRDGGGAGDRPEIR